MLERIYNYPAGLIYTDKVYIESYLKSREPVDRLLVKIYQRAVDAGLYEENPVRVFNDVYRCAIIIANTRNYRMLPVLNKATEKCIHDYNEVNVRFVFMKMLKALVCGQKWIDNAFWLQAFKNLEAKPLEGLNPDICAAVNPLVEKAVEKPHYDTDLSLNPKSISRLVMDGDFYDVDAWVHGKAGNKDTKWEDLMYILGSFRRKNDRLQFLGMMHYSKIPHSYIKIREIEDQMTYGTFDSWWSDKFGVEQSNTAKHTDDYLDDKIADQLDKCREETRRYRYENENYRYEIEKLQKQVEDYRERFNSFSQNSGKTYIQNSEYRTEIENCHKEIERYKAQLEKALDSKRRLTGTISFLQIAKRFKDMLKYSSHDKVSNFFDEMNTFLGGNAVWEAHKDEIVEILATHKESANTMSVGENHGIMAGSINMKMSPENEAKLLEDIKNKNKQI